MVNLVSYMRDRLESRRILLMTHVIVGFPSIEANWRMLEIMQDAGVDMVELQMPFSEPIADGPSFARANQLAIDRGIRLDQYFELVGRASAAFDFPHLMMGYYNTVFRMGHAAFCQRLSASGAQGYIVPDLPFEEYDDLRALSQQSGLSPILLMTPTNASERLAAIGQHARGFVYAVARKGVTGKRTALDEGLGDFVTRCRRYTDLPLALGFGLRTGADVRQLQGTVEMAIVGSALLDAWEEGGETGYREFLRDLTSGRE